MKDVSMWKIIFIPLVSIILTRCGKKEDTFSHTYNKIIANLHETYSALNKIISSKIEKKKLIENYKKILVAISPVIPHFSSECMEILDIKEKLLDSLFGIITVHQIRL